MAKTGPTSFVIISPLTQPSMILATPVSATIRNVTGGLKKKILQISENRNESRHNRIIDCRIPPFLCVLYLARRIQSTHSIVSVMILKLDTLNIIRKVSAGRAH